MKKIPTIYMRDENDRRYVTDEINPECQWVFDGEGVPTRKLDGTCMMLDENGRWWARREVKAGKPVPPEFEVVQFDEVTGKTVGWEPAENSPFYKFLIEALEYEAPDVMKPGTYELIGPKINNNPEDIDRHLLVPHDTDHLVIFYPGPPLELVDCCRVFAWEGVVWHHPDGRRAKLKVRDVRPKEA